MIVFFAITSLFHIGFFVWLAKEWHVMEDFKLSSKLTDLPQVSVLVPIRNESETIQNLLKSLDVQSYPKDRFEVVIIDDNSDDDTYRVIQGLEEKFSIAINYYKLPPDRYGKKEAATMGVNKSKGEYIICTDADCVVGLDWISSYVSMFEKWNYKMITGPVKMSHRTFFEKLQAIEFCGLISYGAVTLSNGKPGMCNAANMAYAKAAFIKVDGYHGNHTIPSGDDEFLLQKIHNSFPGFIGFLKSKKAMVITQPKRSMSEFLNQRIRWSSKWKHHQGAFLKMYAILAFIDFTTLLGLFIMTILSSDLRALFMGFILARWISEIFFQRVVVRYFAINANWYHNFIISLIYPFYVIYLGITSIFGRYSWKGRSY